MNQVDTQPTLPLTLLILMGAAATFTGIGLARFSYSVLLPEMIHQHWFTESEAAYLGAANLLGYAIGALMATRLHQRWGTTVVLRITCAAISLSFIASAWPNHFSVFFLTRLISGIAGGAIMAIAPPVILGLLSFHRKQHASGFVFLGIGMGIFMSATLIPLLVQLSLTFSWLALGVLAAAPYILWQFFCSETDFIIPKHHHKDQENQPKQTTKTQSTYFQSRSKLAIILIIITYGLDAFGYIPHSLLWVDFLNRHYHYSFEASASQWILFGIGAMISPFIIGKAVNRFNWHTTLLCAFILKSVAVAIPLFSSHPIWISLSSIFVGALVPGMVALISGRISELAPAHIHIKLWGIATAVFAITQSISAYIFAFLYTQENTELWLFLPASSALVTAAIIHFTIPLILQPKPIVTEPST